MIEYKFHSKSIQDKSTYNNADAFVFTGSGGRGGRGGRRGRGRGGRRSGPPRHHSSGGKPPAAPSS